MKIHAAGDAEDHQQSDKNHCCGSFGSICFADYHAEMYKLK
jgi:hypothetical protein